MRNTHVTRLSLIAACVVAAASQVSADEPLNDVLPNATLGDLLRKAKWDGIIGTWVDAESSGAFMKSTYDWKLTDRVVEIATIRGKHQDVGLMSVNGKTGVISHVGADSEGGSSIGKWIVQDDGDVVLGMLYTSSTGDQGEVIVRHHLVDNSTMIVTIEAPHPTQVTMIRTKTKNETGKNP